jgi:hypothetical protein
LPSVKPKEAVFPPNRAGDFPSQPRHAAGMKPLVTFTRRVALALLVVAPLGLVLPRLRSGDVGAPDSALAARLRQALAELRLPFPAQLDLVDLTVESPAPMRLAAVVRMTWEPGLRQRRFAVEAADETAAVAALVEAVRVRFSDA